MSNQTIDTVRLLTSHAIDPATEPLTITAPSAPGKNGVNLLYRIEGFNSKTNAASPLNERFTHTNILFQDGSPAAFGVNGITDEVLLAIVADRLRGFQSRALACEEYAAALTNIETAMGWLKHRTRDRQSRGVHGTFEA